MQIKNIANKANRALLERASIRNYDTSVKISRDEMSNILQDAMTAPSSLNLQPWRFFVFDTPEGKETIKPFMMFNQQQWETSSAIIAVYGDMECASYTDPILSAGVENNLITPEYKDKMSEMIAGFHTSFTEERLRNSVLIDCGFVTMQLMLSAKAYGYDTNPIGGFMRKELTEALDLDAKRYIPIILISIGKAAEARNDSIRFSVDEITQWK
ncbi:MAG: nitroreductase family protein [Prevotella sp.]|jgi:nitroreductase|nr:nitroreductase family protein [Prevotella sp.]